VLLIFASSAHAQFDSATISGVVQDTTGAILPGVDVTLTNVGTKNQRQAVTNEAGLYTFPNVPVGAYQITAMLSGFKPVTKAGVQVNAGVNIRVDVALEVGALSETIQVQAATTLVDTSVIGRTVRAEQIAETPLSGRRASQVAQLAPGVVGGNMGGSVPTGVGTFATGVTSINGGRSDEFITTIDGAPSIRIRQAGGFMMGAQNFDTVAESAGPDHQLSGRVRPVVGRAVAAGHEERHAEFPRQRVLEPPERRAGCEHVDAQAQSPREIPAHLQRLRFHTRRADLHSRLLQ
jgi:hypothetical protein